MSGYCLALVRIDPVRHRRPGRGLHRNSDADENPSSRLQDDDGDGLVRPDFVSGAEDGGRQYGEDGAMWQPVDLHQLHQARGSY